MSRTFKRRVFRRETTNNGTTVTTNTTTTAPLKSVNAVFSIPEEYFYNGEFRSFLERYSNGKYFEFELVKIYSVFEGNKAPNSKTDEVLRDTNLNKNYNINLTKERKILWTILGKDFQKGKEWNLRMLEGMNYDFSYLPDDDSNKGELLYSFVADRSGKIEDFLTLNESAISGTWKSSGFEYIYAYYVENIGSIVNVYKRLYKRAC